LTGAVLLFSGLWLSSLFPINKNLWSPTYVLFTTGAALIDLAVLYYLIDVRKLQRWARPFEIFGRNAIVAYVGSGVMARLLTLVKVDAGDGTTVTLQQSLYRSLFASWLPEYWSSFAWALAFVSIWFGIVWVLDRRGIHLRL
jgi:predicted acyltransferase